MRNNYTQSILTLYSGFESIAYSTLLPIRMKISNFIFWLAFLIIMYILASF